MKKYVLLDISTGKFIGDAIKSKKNIEFLRKEFYPNNDNIFITILVSKKRVIK